MHLSFSKIIIIEVESIKDDDLSINVLKKVADGKLEIEAHVKVNCVVCF